MDGGGGGRSRRGRGRRGGGGGREEGEEGEREDKWLAVCNLQKLSKCSVPAVCETTFSEERVVTHTATHVHTNTPP